MSDVISVQASGSRVRWVTLENAKSLIAPVTMLMVVLALDC
jgi:hypothetical protein